MGLLEEEARFLVAKYGTAAGPTGLPRTWPSTPVGLDLPLLMVLLGLIIFIIVLALLFRDWQRSEQERAAYERIYA